ncbi:MAG: phospho-N-acetylmuramoyl-pentapeptide-transferase [Bacilli bacterium]|nr:phospho-N-acetylmuramoyl-pentapeptide-transferase [Bacilli bacterium]
MNIYVKSFLIAFVVAIFMYVFLIPLLRRIKIGQSIRREGPKKHYGKAGTPTMGGLIILIATIVAVFYLKLTGTLFSKYDLLLLFMPLLLYGTLGFIDDYLIVIKKSNKGLNSGFKLFIQIVWAGMYFYLFLDQGLSSVIDFFGWKVDFKWFYGVLILLMLVGFSNAVNFSDGLDGLAAGLLIIALAAAAVISRFKGETEITLFSLALLGAVLAFFCYNFNPAKIFMGDVGSLALGATVANLFILLKMEVLLLIVGFVFLLEGLSVVIQVIYFKLTGGKRIFLMSPIHHHFELKGMNEWEIDVMFWLIAMVMAAGAVILAYLYYL